MTVPPVAGTLTAGTRRSLDALAGVTLGRADPRGAATTEDAALRRVAREFESIFIGEMLKAMRSTQLESGLFGHDRSSEMYNDLHDQAMASDLAGAGETKTNPGGLGIGKMLYDELRRTGARP